MVALLPFFLELQVRTDTQESLCAELCANPRACFQPLLAYRRLAADVKTVGGSAAIRRASAVRSWACHGMFTPTSGKPRCGPSHLRCLFTCRATNAPPLLLQRTLQHFRRRRVSHHHSLHPAMFLHTAVCIPADVCTAATAAILPYMLVPVCRASPPKS